MIKLIFERSLSITYVQLYKQTSTTYQVSTEPASTVTKVACHLGNWHIIATLVSDIKWSKYLYIQIQKQYKSKPKFKSNKSFEVCLWSLPEWQRQGIGEGGCLLWFPNQAKTWSFKSNTEFTFPTARALGLNMNSEKNWWWVLSFILPTAFGSGLSA